MWLLLGCGTVVCLWTAATDRRARTKVTVAVNALLWMLALGAYFPLSTLPAPAELARADLAPEFTLPDHHGRDVSLADLRKDGHVLLVFYRGHW